MEKVLKGYKFRIYPNNDQKILIEKSFGCSRYIYNYFLNLSKEKTSIKAYDYIKELPRLIKENDIIVTEKLKINEMVKNKNLSKRIYDATWNELIRILTYKSKWLGKKCYQIDTYYPSSKVCSHCGYKNSKLKDLSIRKWECNKCHNENERDLNASINIMFEGIKKYIKELQVS